MGLVMSLIFAGMSVPVAIVGGMLGQAELKEEEQLTWRSEFIPGMITVVDGMGSYASMDMPTVAIYGSNNLTSNLLEGEQAIVTASGGHVFADGRPPHRIFITNAGTAPICIAGVSFNQANGSSLMVSGNLGRLCGADNYESRISVLRSPHDLAPACVWVDRHGSNGIRLPGLGFDLDTEVHQDYNITSVEDLCKPPFMTLEHRSEEEMAERRQLVAPTFASQLIKSNMTDSGAAVRLCEGKFTKGPDFVSSSEKLYCEMETRQLYPFCEETLWGICFDDGLDELVEREGAQKHGDGGVVKKSATITVLKSFEQVDIWN